MVAAGDVLCSDCTTTHPLLAIAVRRFAAHMPCLARSFQLQNGRNPYRLILQRRSDCERDAKVGRWDERLVHLLNRFRRPSQLRRVVIGEVCHWPMTSLLTRSSLFCVVLHQVRKTQTSCSQMTTACTAYTKLTSSVVLATVLQCSLRAPLFLIIPSYDS